jgi:hypothetical protein
VTAASFAELLKANLVTGTPSVDNWSAYRLTAVSARQASWRQAFCRKLVAADRGGKLTAGASAGGRLAAEARKRKSRSILTSKPSSS